jgi:hypothetical protein
MTILAWLNRCAFVPTAYSDSDDFEVNGSAPVTGFYLPSECANPAVVDAATYHYFARSADKTQHEEGDANWDDATGTLLRATGTVRNSSNAGALVNFSAAPIVTVGSPTAADMKRAGNLVLNGEAAGLTGLLDISGDPVVRAVLVPNNAITDIDASYCTDLQKLDARVNQLASVDVSGCGALTSISISAFLTMPLSILDISSCPALIFVLATSCSFDEATVDAILGTLDSNGLSDGEADLSGGTSAPPSAAGLTSKSNLEGNGWTVSVNS